MKAHYLLTPLAFGLAACMAGAALADGSGASAVIMNTQMLDGNYVRNSSTENSAVMAESINNASGSLPANMVAGDINQQANTGALSAADAFFVLGIPINASAMASIDVTQESYYNTAVNSGAYNQANLLGSVNQSAGNIAVNLAAGNFNQQKTDFAVAASPTALTAVASVQMEQHSHYNETLNYPALELFEADSLALTAAASGIEPVISPVVNSATALGSLNGLSGYVGINIASGSGNQQNNALSIAAGCTTCQLP